MHKEVYSNPNLMKKIAHVKRYIDNGPGFFTGNKRQFELWLNTVNHALHPYGLLIDECTFKELGLCVAFFDIEFCMDLDGMLFTDLHVKPTDSRSYLHFGSSHPNHVYSGIVYSQCFRLRRIIISHDVLKCRIAELCNSFVSCGYPKSLVNRISTKVLSMNRDLSVLIKNKVAVNGTLTVSNSPIHNIRIISTHGTAPWYHNVA